MTEPVPPDAFRDWIAPHVTAVRDFTVAVDAVAEHHGGLPSAASGAMSEHAEEQNYRTRSEWQQPVADTHTFGEATLRAATDYVRGIAELFATDHPPLYAHLTLARAALEAAVDGTRRPRISDGVVELSGSATDAKVGDLLYSRLSAVDHVTWFGLLSAFDANAAKRDERAGTATVPITVDGAQVSAYLFYVIKVLHAAATARFTLMGWLDQRWVAASADGEALEGRLLETAVKWWPSPDIRGARMSKTEQHALAATRERVASSQQRPGYHPYWTTAPVVPDEPLWAISFRPHPGDEWLGPYNTATADLDQAIDEARAYLRAPKRAKISVRPIVPRSDTYRGARDILTAMMLAVPPEHPAASDMLHQLQAALRVVTDAESEGRYFGGLAVKLPIALEVDELRVGRPRSIKTVSWMDPGGEWPAWNRCTV